MIQSSLHPLRLKADPSRVVVRPFHLAWQGNRSDPGRARRLVDMVLSLDDREIGRQLKESCMISSNATGRRARSS